VFVGYCWRDGNWWVGSVLPHETRWPSCWKVCFCDIQSNFNFYTRLIHEIRGCDTRCSSAHEEKLVLDIIIIASCAGTVGALG
jgi:hypothetical protein